MSTRDIEARLQEIYGVSVGRDLISRVTDAVMEDAREWQTRPLEDVYPVLFLDALVLKIRDGGSAQRKACYLALAIGIDGQRDVLGMWFLSLVRCRTTFARRATCRRNACVSSSATHTDGR